MKKRNLLTAGLSVMLLLGAANVASAQDDTTEATPLDFEFAVVTGDYAEFVDILEVIEVARGEFEGVVTQVDLDRYRDGHYYDIEMESDTEDFEIKIDATTLEILESETESDNDLDEEELAKFNGEIASIEELVESTREYFDGIIEDIDLDEDDGVIIYEVDITDDHLDIELEINAEDLSIIEFEIETRDGDSDEHRDAIRANIEAFDPSAVGGSDDDDDDFDDDNDDDDDDFDDDDNNDDDDDDDNDDD